MSKVANMLNMVQILKGRKVHSLAKELEVMKETMIEFAKWYKK